MDTIQGYHIDYEISRSHGSIIYSGFRDDDTLPVIIKMAEQDHDAIALLHYEYYVLQTIGIAGAPRVCEFREMLNASLLITEKFSGVTLRKLIETYQSISLREFFPIAFAIVSKLDAVHKKGFTLLSLSLDTAVYNSQSKTIEFIDYTKATVYELPRSVMSEQSNDAEAPELYRHIYEAVDYRSDYYSMGCIFFQLFTGMPPLLGEDHQKILHEHGVSPRLIMCITTLLSESQHSRYQSLEAITYDLQEIHRTPNRDTAVGLKNQQWAPFSNKNKMYHQKTLDDLTTTLLDKKGGLCLIEGDRGCGKSTLIMQTITEKYSCKEVALLTFESSFLDKEIPYKPFISFAQSLLRQKVGLPEDKKNIFSRQIQSIVKEHGELLISQIPELESYLDHKQFKTVERNGYDQEYLFIRLIRELLSVLTNDQKHHFLICDNSEYLDNGSQKLLNYIEISPIPKVTVVVTTEDMDRENSFVGKKRYVVQNFTSDTIKKIYPRNSFISDEDYRDFTETAFRIAQGNFYALFALEKMILHYESTTQKLYINRDKLNHALTFSNYNCIVDDTIASLPTKCYYLLMIASCLGRHFTIKDLSAVTDLSDYVIGKHLIQAVQKNIIFTHENSFQLFVHRNNTVRNLDIDIPFSFCNCHIQERLYNSIDLGKRNTIHLKLGRVIVESFPEEQVEENLLSTLAHFNNGRSSIKDEDEALGLSLMNLRAGKRVKKHSSYFIAYHYYAIAREMIRYPFSSDNYYLSFTVNQEYMECAYLCGIYDKAESTAEYLLKNGQNPMEKAGVYFSQLRYFSITGQDERALHCGIEGIRHLGITLFKKPFREMILKEKMLLSFNIRKKEDTSLTHGAQNENVESRGIIRIMGELVFITHRLGLHNLFAYIVFKQMNIILSEGLCPEATGAYCGYALYLSTNGDLKEAQRYLDIARTANDSLSDGQFTNVINFVETYSLNSWKKHVKCSVDMYKHFIQDSYHRGENYYREFLCALIGYESSILTLSEKNSLNRRYYSEIRHSHFIDQSTLIHQYYNALMGKCDNAITLSDNSFEEHKFAYKLEQSNNFFGTALYLLTKIKLFYLYDRHKEGAILISQVNQIRDVFKGTYFEIECAFFSFMIYAMNYRKGERSHQKRNLKYMKEEYHRIKYYYQISPVNTTHLVHIIEAEFAWKDDEFIRAAVLLRNAVAVSSKNRFTEYLALSYEMLAKLYIECNDEEVANLYMTRAADTYRKWGALRKDIHIKESYASWIDFTKTVPQIPLNESINSNEIAGKNIISLADTIERKLTKVLHNLEQYGGNNELKDALHSIYTDTQDIKDKISHQTQKGYSLDSIVNDILLHRKDEFSQHHIEISQTVSCNDIVTTEKEPLAHILDHIVEHIEESLQLIDLERHIEFLFSKNSEKISSVKIVTHSPMESSDRILNTWEDGVVSLGGEIGCIKGRDNEFGFVISVPILD